ncbi:MAG TPA: DUF2188 domain-containing protein [Sphingomicrobium sp.]|nr:DUF2188 domain-containing protein [Sphingomicrobium sp.]
MSRAIYYVLKDGERWKIRFEGKDYSYATQTAAKDAARGAARKAHANGRDSQVLVQGSDGQWQTEWTYGNDPSNSPG